MKQKNNKGITLIALILTIIVLLILAVVAINAVKGDGIIAHAKNAKTQYSEAQKNEQELLSNYELMLAQETGNAWKQDKTKVTKGDLTLNLGDTITNFTAGNKTWKVLGAENGKLLLTTTKDIANKTISGDDAVLGVWNEATSSYKNAEDELNKICVENISLDDLTDEIRSKVTEVRSIKVEDINRVTGYDPKTAENGKTFGAGNIYQYENEVTYSVVKDESGTVTGVKYESKNVENKSGTSAEYTQFWAPNTKENITGTYTARCTRYSYWRSSTGLKESSNAYKMLFGTARVTYWLASSYVKAGEGYAVYGLFFVGEEGCVNSHGSLPAVRFNNDGTTSVVPRMESGTLWDTRSGSIVKKDDYATAGVRPVVSLASDVKLTETSAGSGEWNIIE